MSTTTHELQVIVNFTDGTYRTYTLPNIPETLTASEIETRIKALNNGTAEHAADFKKAFVSNDGEQVEDVGGAYRVTITEEVIYNG